MNDNKFCENCLNAEWYLVEESWNIQLWEWEYSSICEECSRKNPEAMHDLWKEAKGYEE